MTAHKHLIAHQWIKQTLVPFLLYVFASTLPHPADISDEIHRSIEFCLGKPDHPSDGDDLVFERIFMATMHRHKNLGPDLLMVVDNLEPLAKYLIRRAQLKGPYELLGRTDVGSGAWVAYEAYRLSNLAVEPENTQNELRPPMRPPSVAIKPPPAEDDLDPRLVHAQPGDFAAASLSGYLTPEEDSYYRQRNHNLEQAQLRRQQQSIYSPAAPELGNGSFYTLPGRGASNATVIGKSPYYQQPQGLQAPNSIVMPRETQFQAGVSTQTNFTPRTRIPLPVSQPKSMVLGMANSRAPCVPEQHAVSRLQTAPFPSTQTEAWMQTPRHCPDNGRPLSSQPTQPQPRLNLQQQPPRFPQFRIPPSQYQPGQRQTIQHLPPPQQQAQPLQGGPQYLPFLPRTPNPPTLQPTPPPTIPPYPTPSSDSAHPRDNNYSHAAQHRASPIPANVTAQDRDNLARSIIQRQQSLGSTTNRVYAHTPPTHPPAYEEPLTGPPCGTHTVYSAVRPTASSAHGEGMERDMLLQQPLGVQRTSGEWGEGVDASQQMERNAVQQLRDAAGLGAGNSMVWGVDEGGAG